mgnify:CR=1 FL=1
MSYKYLQDKYPQKTINDIFSFVCPDVSEKKECNGIQLPKAYCSRFAIQSAMKIFDWKEKYSYFAEDAWNLKYKKNVYEVLWSEEDSLPLNYNNLFDGLLMGIYRPKSEYNNKKDIKGFDIKYTHLALFVKENNIFNYFDTKCILHYFKNCTEYVSLNDIFGDGKRSEEKFILKEILMYKSDYTQEELDIFKKILVSKENF